MSEPSKAPGPRVGVHDVFIEVLVEEHAALPDGCSMRFRAAGEVRDVSVVRYEPEDGALGVRGIWRVEAECGDGARTTARAVSVDDSGAGMAMLVFGREHGLRLISPDGRSTVAEPYLLLSLDACVET